MSIKESVPRECLKLVPDLSIDIGILDIGYGNLQSLKYYFDNNKLNTYFVRDATQASNYEVLVLPGVGSFGYGIQQLSQSGLGPSILERHQKQFPILGICLGFQMLSSKSEEDSDTSGLGIFDNNFIKLNKGIIGWKKTKVQERTQSLDCNMSFYYNHNYASPNVSNADNYWLTEDHLVAFQQLKNTIGVQFHPEKSQKSGYVFLQYLLTEIWKLR